MRERERWGEYEREREREREESGRERKKTDVLKLYAYNECEHYVGKTGESEETILKSFLIENQIMKKKISWGQDF